MLSTEDNKSHYKSSLYRPTLVYDQAFVIENSAPYTKITIFISIVLSSEDSTEYFCIIQNSVTYFYLIILTVMDKIENSAPYSIFISIALSTEDSTTYFGYYV